MREFCTECGRGRPDTIADPSCSTGGYCNWQIRMTTKTKTKVQWQEPSGCQWGHPFYPLVEYVTRSREFDTPQEAEAYADGLRRGGASGVKVNGW